MQRYRIQRTREGTVAYDTIQRAFAAYRKTKHIQVIEVPLNRWHEVTTWVGQLWHGTGGGVDSAVVVTPYPEEMRRFLPEAKFNEHGEFVSYGQA